jgi:hypothetical protein
MSLRLYGLQREMRRGGEDMQAPSMSYSCPRLVQLTPFGSDPLTILSQVCCYNDRRKF